eukprot:CAMPEP_0204208734 /NCGR_PEP_ID=MMETSP0361-20130328/72705_1 /ASSEMBLY_ACC=CAM_ASM_000343 /TAXON_ID=268821 /ORGANISM="Scrippsiella Hangoei, Strain SHTV-5" /LENGTH=68 /DNA_ID=CAMNT_0051172575 /DNA_START=72 /DNA_END=274 /DNA_ORIENTATION=+
MIARRVVSMPLALGFSRSLSSAARSHWKNFIYRTEARHWHSLWCRWHPSGSLLQKFHAERIFEPLGGG